MGELVITSELIRKRARIGNKCDEQTNKSTWLPSTEITSLPVEILLKILSYLSLRQLRIVKKVSRYFKRLVCDPILWHTYEVTCNNVVTSKVIAELKRMRFLKKLSISCRPDCDDILRHVSVANKCLEELYILHCTGSTSKLYLRSSHLIRILERCRSLHTINITGSRFRGRKFYRLLGDIGPRLRAVSTTASKSQFCTFIKHAHQIAEDDRETIASLCRGVDSWSPLHYFVKKHPDRGCTAIVKYWNNMEPIDMNCTMATCCCS